MSTSDLRNFKLLSDTFHRKRGNVAACAAELGVSRETLHRFIRENPEASKALEEARNFHHEDEIDYAMSISYQFMQDYRNNPALASRHAIYTLDKKGHSRGYNRSDTPVVDTNINMVTSDGLAIGTNISAPIVPDSFDKSAE